MLKTILSDMKPLRVFLISFALLLIILRPDVGAKAVYQGWEIVPTILAPSMTPIIFMLIMLDSFMSKILMLDKPVESRASLRRVMWINLVIGFILIAYWAPYFYNVAKHFK